MARIKKRVIKMMLGSASGFAGATHQKKFSITPYIKSYFRKYMAGDIEKKLDIIIAILVLLAVKFEDDRSLILFAKQIVDRGKKSTSK